MKSAPPTSRRRARLGPAFGALLLCATGLVGACGSEDQAPPAGTVLMVSGTPILQQDVDDHIEALLIFEPSFTVTHRRRLYLTNVALGQAYGIAQAGERRAEALQAAQDWLASPDSQPAPMDQFAGNSNGHWLDQGLDVWLAARKLEVGQSSGIVELIGRYAVIRMLSRDNNPNPKLERLNLSVETFPYDDSPETLVNRCQDGTLRIVDPAWKEIIPAQYRYKMKEQK